MGGKPSSTAHVQERVSYRQSSYQNAWTDEELYDAEDDADDAAVTAMIAASLGTPNELGNTTASYGDSDPTDFEEALALQRVLEDSRNDSTHRGAASNELSTGPSRSFAFHMPTNSPLQQPVATNRVTPQKAVQTVRCEMCDICCPSQLHYQQHLDGKAHKKLILANELARQSKGGASNVPSQLPRQQPASIKGVDNTTQKTAQTFHCEMCYVRCQSQIAFQQHLDGIGHKNQLIRANVLARQAKRAATSTGPSQMPANNPLQQSALTNGVNNTTQTNKTAQTFHCEICDIHSPTKFNHQQHLNGKAHKKNVVWAKELARKAKGGSTSTGPSQVNRPAMGARASTEPLQPPRPVKSAATGPSPLKSDQTSKGPSTSSENAEKDKLIKELAANVKKLQVEKMNLIQKSKSLNRPCCVVCLDNSPNVIFFDCKHVALCEECFRAAPPNTFTTCPTCRRQVRRAEKVFF